MSWTKPGVSMIRQRTVLLLPVSVLTVLSILGCARQQARSSIAIDSLLADSGSVYAGISRLRDTVELLVFRRSGSVHPVYRTGPIPYVPRVEISADRRTVLWSFAGDDLLGGVAVRLGADAATVIYQQWYPEGGLCRVPRLLSVAGATYLVQPLAAAFPVSWCVDPMQDCVGQFHSTWPQVSAIGDSGLLLGRAPHGFYDSLRADYLTELRRLASGDTARGQNLRAPQTILSRCGPAAVDSLKALAARAATASRSQ